MHSTGERCLDTPDAQRAAGSRGGARSWRAGRRRQRARASLHLTILRHLCGLLPLGWPRLAHLANKCTATALHTPLVLGPCDVEDRMQPRVGRAPQCCPARHVKHRRAHTTFNRRSKHSNSSSPSRASRPSNPMLNPFYPFY